MCGSSFADINMSGWRVEDGLRLSKANLAGATIAGCRYDGMTVDGILLSDLLDAYHARPKGPPEAG